MRYIPNILTLLRFFLIIPFLIFLYQKQYEAAFYAFFLAGLTDGFDGLLARRFGWQSVFGSFIDPLADKFLVASSFVALALLSILPWWLVVLVLLRDMTLLFGALAWLRFIRRRVEFAPTLLSKINTTFQIMLVCACIFELAFFPALPYLKTILIVLTTITTCLSYMDYLWTWGKKAYKTALK